MPDQDLTPAGLSLNDLVSSANDAAITARNVTTAMLATAVTLAATILASSDEAIIRDQLAAPFGLNASVRLSTAYALMPPVFLFLHINGLLQLHVLAERLKLFEEQLKLRVGIAKDRDKWRRRLHGFAFVQHFSDDESLTEAQDKLLEYVRNLLLMTVNLVTTGIVPLALLLSAQVSFLRYQSETITLFHRVIVILDLAFIIWFYISQARLAKSSSERPSILLIGGGAIVAVCWLLGFGPWLSGALLLGMLTGWATNVVGRATSRMWFATFLTATLGYLVWWSVGARSPFLVSCGLGFACSVASLAVWQSTPLNLLSRFRQYRLAKIALWTLRYAPLSLIVIWFADSQAVVPSGTEPYCQIRWNWKESRSAALSDTDESRDVDDVAESDQSWLARQRAKSHANLTFGLNFIVKPLFGYGELDCPSANTPQTPPVGISTAPVRRANILDRWSCSAWEIGCRFVSLPSSILLASPINAGAIEKIDKISEDQRKEAVLRSLGVNLRERHLRFARLEQSRLYGTDLRGADLRGSDLDSASFTGGLLSNTDLRFAKLDDANFKSADLARSDLRGASLSYTDFSDAWLGDVNIQGTLLDNTIFENARLIRARLQGAHLSDVWLSGASLKQARLDGATFESGYMTGSSFIEAHLEGAEINLSDFDGALLIATNLDGAVSEYLNLSSAILIAASFRGATVSVGDCDGLLVRSLPATAEWPRSERDKYLTDLRGLLGKNADALFQHIESRVLKNVHALPFARCEEQATDLSSLSTPESDVANRLLKLACDDDIAAKGILRNLSDLDTALILGDYSDSSELAQALSVPIGHELKKDKASQCDGIRKLDDKSIERFRRLVAASSDDSAQ